MSSIRNSRASFTLIELLVVLAIVAILSVVVILTLNPAELIKQARDSNRLSDLSALNNALGLFNTDVNAGFMGTSSVVYVSIADTTSTCANLGLPTLPTGYSYACVTSTSTKNIDGTGWIPVNFKLISFGNPLSSLPVDPVNTTSSRNYYTYTTGGSWDITATLEASKNKLGGANDKVSTDGGSYPDLYETGTKLTLEPIDYGDPYLVGYWNFDETTGTTFADSSGSGRTGRLVVNNSTFIRTTGKVGGAINWQPTCGGGCSGTINSYIVVNPFTTTVVPGTYTAWVYRTGGGTIFRDTGSKMALDPLVDGVYFNVNYANAVNNCPPVSVNSWNFIAATFDGATLKCYLNSIMVKSATPGNLTVTSPTALNIATRNDADSSFYSGILDELRIYNRALSAAEISALYNATK